MKREYIIQRRDRQDTRGRQDKHASKQPTLVAKSYIGQLRRHISLEKCFLVNILNGTITRRTNKKKKKSKKQNRS